MNHSEFFKKNGLKVSTDDGWDLQIRGLSSLPGEKKDHLIQYARDNKPGILYELLWAEAWNLAEWIDNERAPPEERQARLPELLKMRDRLNGLEVLLKKKPKPKKMQVDTTKNQTCDVCRCHDAGKCYSYVFNDKKPGKPISCQVAFIACPGFMEKSDDCESEF